MAFDESKWELARKLLEKEGDSPPVRYRGAIHVRIGPRKGLASAQDERILNEKRRHRDSPHDIWPVAHASLADLRLRYFEEDYLPRAFSAEVIETNDRTLEQRLAATKMIASIDDLVPTRLGVYVLGKTPRFLLENFYVQFLRVDGADLGDPVLDAGLIEGTIAEIASEMESRLRSHIHVGVDNASGELEVRTPTYPIVALRELARNAILHRSYEGTHAPARINWFEDRVEIINPGGPYGLAAVSPFGAPGVTDYRNPNLAEAMRVLGLVQRFGVGIAGARKALRDNGNPELEFEVDANHVRAIVRRRG